MIPTCEYDDYLFYHKEPDAARQGKKSAENREKACVLPLLILL
jgi:hypothetical protein